MSFGRFSPVVAATLVVAAGCGRTRLDERSPGDGLSVDGGAPERGGGSGAPGGTAGARGDSGDPAGGGGPAGSGGAAGAAGAGGAAGSGGATGSGGVPAALVVLPRGPVVPIGQTVQINGYVQRPGNYADVTDQMTWSLLPAGTAAATISNVAGQRGRMQALAAGQVTVQGAYQGQTTSILAQVTAATIDRIVVLPALFSLTIGMTQQLRAVATYSDNTTLPVDGPWRSTDESVATASNNPGSRGLVTAVGPGKALATIGFAGSEASATALVQAPVTVTRLDIFPANPTAPVNGMPAQLALVATYSGGNTANLTFSASWVSTDPAVALVAGGNVTCVSGGSVIVSASAMGQTASTIVTCVAVSLVSLQLIPGDSRVPAGTSLQFYLTAHLADRNAPDVTNMATWSSDDVAVAAVQTGGGQRGIVHTIMQGKARITAGYRGMTATTTLTVTPP
jgi:Bacterial Ig-like domain (group 2)